MDFADLNRLADWLEGHAESIEETADALPLMVLDAELHAFQSVADSLRDRANAIRTQALVSVARGAA